MLEREKLADMKEQFWRDKSRIQWSEEGDRNTSYYHRIAKIRRRRNTFNSLKINSVWVDDKLQIKNGILDHFSSRFKLSDTSNTSVGDLDLKTLSSEDAASLERPILEEEVVSSLKLLGQNKAPGPDGFQVGIILKCWSFMKDDIMRIVKDFENSGKIDWHLKSTFLALIPKKQVVEEIKDLRPISLTSTIYKAISKILAERLKDLEGLADILGCSCDSFPTQYLGMPLGDKANSAAKWDRIVELCKARLASWKRRILTRAGWRNVCKPINIGGLGIRSLKHLNCSLLQKWWWRLGNEPKALWSRVVKDKHGPVDLGWRTHKPKGKHGISLWRNIYSTAEDFFKLCQFKIGKGDRVRLGEDKWCIQGPLYALFPSLYNISSTKNTCIFAAYHDSANGFYWILGLSHRRRLYDNEISELSVMLPLLESIVFLPNEEDQLVWLGDKKGMFTVKAAYAHLSQGTNPPISFPSSKVWSRAWPHRVGFFLWKVCLNRLPTLSNLHHRRTALHSPSLCYLCGIAEETEDHLLLQCPFSLRVWNYFIGLAGGGTLLQTVKDVIVGWKNFPFSAQGLQLWKRLPAAIPWALWKARNDIAFERKPFKVNDVIRNIKMDAFNWSRGLDCFKGINTSTVIVGWAHFFLNPP
ncbi:uncharacterized protein LOC113323373 isoform X2 [Papaver somniferum]|uniref:uncharacterized protein LOC113323373 isoform X2 n=1 Tax=Papaver somniferum TaxID=3469 RepID=UPI000E6FA6ED|nr:uncharacterized protein LOC113323373 isoform X2 [Papaver somniferum]